MNYQIRSRSRFTILGATFLVCAQFAASQTAGQKSAPAQATPPAAAKTMGHRDHNPKHGGIFFMAMDNSHHLEGTLEKPGTLVVYLYDDHTRPLPPAKVKEATGEVSWGESDNAPKTALSVSKDGKTLEAGYPGKLQLPVTAVLRVRFPGAAAKSRPELFTFPFRHFTSDQPAQPGAGGMDHSMHDMSNM